MCVCLEKTKNLWRSQTAWGNNHSHTRGMGMGVGKFASLTITTVIRRNELKTRFSLPFPSFCVWLSLYHRPNNYLSTPFLFPHHCPISSPVSLSLVLLPLPFLIPPFNSFLLHTSPPTPKYYFHHITSLESFHSPPLIPIIVTLELHAFPLHVENHTL